MLTQLNAGWTLQSSEIARLPGEKISLASCKTDGWIPAIVPGTIIGAMAAKGDIPDPMIGNNMEKFEGFKGGNDKLHTLMPMPDDSPYRKPWWFRNVFRYKKPAGQRKVWLELEGISYSANVWLNGQRVATPGHATGIFKRITIDVTKVIRTGSNCLALELSAAGPDDFGHTWIDWAPEPPDNSMGIIQPVSLRDTGDVVIRHPFVRTDLDVKTLKKAALDITATLENTADSKTTVTLEAKIGDILVSQKVTLDPREKRQVILPAGKHRALNIKNPRIWWPYQMGKSELYTLKLKARVGRSVSDNKTLDFGIRSVTSRLNKHGARQFTVNGRDILIRGSAWSPDLFLRQSKKQVETDIAYVKNMNLNAIRLEGTPVSSDFWDICNRQGVLVLHGITCVNYWEHSRDWREEDYRFVEDSVRSLFSNIRIHPCLMGFMIASDFPTVPKAEDLYLKILDEMPIDVPVTANSAKKYSPKLGPTGMIHGPYDFVPPVFWYQGGALHFNTECGPDICLPTIDTLKQTFPQKADLTVRSHAWNMHCGLQLFTSTISGDKALSKRYGVSEKNLEKFVHASHIMGYECWRAMYEAWVRNVPKSTGVIGWMLNSCWPSLMWQMYDYFNNPLGAFYGTQKACQPLHVQYAYDDHTIWAVNQTPDNADDLTVQAFIYDIQGRLLWHKNTSKTLKPFSQNKCFKIPQTLKLPEIYFLFLKLKQGRKQLPANVYWLSANPDQVNIIQNVDQKAVQKPQKTFANFKNLLKMPKSDVQKQYTTKKVGQQYQITLTLTNGPQNIAFFLWARAYSRKTGRPVTPICWNDNCVTLMPGETARLIGRINCEDIGKNDLVVKIDGSNLKK